MDKAMIKQYMPIKPIKCGIKMWCRVDSHSGSLCDFDIYTGCHRDGLEKALGYFIVTCLCKGIKESGEQSTLKNFSLHNHC